ncbi:MAG: hypothetical protein AB7F89_08880 [Pirellulaceae bacterium]
MKTSRRTCEAFPRTPAAGIRCGVILALGLAMLFLVPIADACPNCRETLAGEPDGLARGFFWSILFMLSMPFLILGGLSSYFYWEVRRARRMAAKVAGAAVGSPFAHAAAADSGTKAWEGNHSWEGNESWETADECLAAEGSHDVSDAAHPRHEELQPSA